MTSNATNCNDGMFYSAYLILIVMETLKLEAFQFVEWIYRESNASLKNLKGDSKSKPENIALINSISWSVESIELHIDSIFHHMSQSTLK